MKNGGFRELDASANDAMRRYFDRTGWQAVDMKMPFAELVEAEDDGEEEPPGEYEYRQRYLGIKAMFRFIKGHGVHPAQMLKQLVAVGRAMNEEPFAGMTMEECGDLFGETKSAHSWRCKLLSGEIKLAGMHGSQLPGQKREETSESYRASAKGNQNRKRDKKRVRKREKSFLRQVNALEASNKKS